MSDKPKKTLWHGDLRAMGQVEVLVKSEAQKSKYGKDKPDYVVLIIDGHERQYMVESPACGEFFRGKVGQSILIEARDSREQATIHLMAPARGSSQQQQAAPPQQQRRTDVAPKQEPTTNQPPASTAPTNQPPKTAEKTREEKEAANHAAFVKAITDAKKFASRRVNALEVIFKAVDHLAERRQKAGRALTPEHYSALVTSIFIDMNRAGMADSFPHGDLDKYLPPETPKQ